MHFCGITLTRFDSRKSARMCPRPSTTANTPVGVTTYPRSRSVRTHRKVSDSRQKRTLMNVRLPPHRACFVSGGGEAFAKLEPHNFAGSGSGDLVNEVNCRRYLVCR